MIKKSYYLLIISFLLMSGLLTAQTASANSVVAGTFVGVSYEDVQLDNGETEKVLKSITIENKEGKTITLSIDKYAVLSVNTLMVTIDAFKKGMAVEADVELRRVKELRGISEGSVSGSIEQGDRVVAGTVSIIDKKGKYLKLRSDDGKINTYYLNAQTEIFRDTMLSDLSVLYEGDRVKLLFSEYNTNYIATIEVNTKGTKIQALYKGTLQQIDPITNKLTIKDEKMFLNWRWDSTDPSSMKSYSYSGKTPIYVGNQQISRDRLRYYANSEVYFVTIKQFGKEIIEKMVIKRMNERTFYEPMYSFYPKAKIIGFRNEGLVSFHDGTILIRNGRLVDSETVQESGSAFVVTDGSQKSQYANVVHVTNDGFQSPNLAQHSLYYGKISSGGSSKLYLDTVSVLTDNYWKTTASAPFAISNDTVAFEDIYGSVQSVIPRESEFNARRGQMGYFYVYDNHVVAAHILGYYQPEANLVSVGRISSLHRYWYDDLISVRNVSQWRGGGWEAAPAIINMNIEQAMIIKDGKVISANELNINDRLYLLHESTGKARVLLVN